MGRSKFKTLGSLSPCFFIYQEIFQAASRELCNTPHGHPKAQLINHNRIYYPQSYAQAVLEVTKNQVISAYVSGIGSQAADPMFLERLAARSTIHQRDLVPLVIALYNVRLREAGHLPSDGQITHPELFFDACAEVLEPLEAYPSSATVLAHAQQLASDPASLKKGAIKGKTKASTGATEVFLPPELSQVVLKDSGPDCERRLFLMDQVRALCTKHKWRHLVVPKATIHNGFLIEERLPIRLGLFEQIHQYNLHADQMGQAIREFVELCCSTYLPDLILRSNLTGWQIPRYDNIPFFRRPDGEWSIGLIDLEHWQLDRSESIARTILDMGILFPHHHPDILAIGRRYDRKLQESEATILRKWQGAKRFASFVQGHVDYLKTHGITPAAPFKRPEINDERRSVIVDEILTKLKQKYQSNLKAMSLFEDPDFPPYLQRAISAVDKQINHPLRQQLAAKGELTTYAELADCRSYREIIPSIYAEHLSEDPMIPRIDEVQQDCSEDPIYQAVYLMILQQMQGREIYHVTSRGACDCMIFF